MVREHGQSISIHDVYSGMPKAGTHRAHALGEGACGKVYKIKNITTGKEFACKSIKMKSGSNPEKERKQLMEEITLIKMLDHPNTIKVIEVFQTPRELQIVMEMCTGGELFDRLYEQPSNKVFGSPPESPPCCCWCGCIGFTFLRPHLFDIISFQKMGCQLFLLAFHNPRIIIRTILHPHSARACNSAYNC